MKLKKNLIRSYHRYKWGYFFVIPIFILFIIFRFIPVFHSLLLAFEGYDGSWGFENFRWMLGDEVFRTATRNTLLYTAVIVPKNVILSLILASLIQPFNNKTQTFFRGAYYLPQVTSQVVQAMVWLWILNPHFGLLNNILENVFSVGGLPWLTSPDTAMWTIILTEFLLAPGPGIIIYLAAMNGIPRTLYESAEIDGASSLRKWWDITVPLVKSTTLYITVIYTIASFRIFTKVDIMTDGGPGNSTQVIVKSIYDTAFRHFDFGYASAQALMLFIVIGLLSIIQFKYLSSDVEY